MAGALCSPTSLGGLSDEGAAAEVDALLERSPRALPRLDDEDFWETVGGTTPPRRVVKSMGAVPGVDAAEGPPPTLPPPAACPNLLAGRHHDKVIRLAPNRWIKIGRNPKSTVVLPNSGVSRDHCSVRWDPYVRLVELKTEIDSTTMVNGTAVTLTRVELQHADQIRVVGKGQHFDFVVDTRPVTAAIANPVDAAKEEDRLRTQPKQRRVLLQRKLVRVEKEIREFDAKISKAEQDYTEVQTRRSKREQDQTTMEEQYKFYVEDSARLERHLEESRHDWNLKLQTCYKENAVSIQPIIEATAELQDKVEKLQLKKDEMAREFHPQRYAVADVRMMELQSPAASTTETHNTTDKGGADSEGEDDALAFDGLPNLKEAKRGADALAPPAAAADGEAGTAGGEAGADGGDAKRAKTDGGEAGAVGGEGAAEPEQAAAEPELQGTVLD